MTEQEFLECKRKGEALRARHEQAVVKALIESGIVDEALAFIEATQQTPATNKENINGHKLLIQILDKLFDMA